MRWPVAGARREHELSRQHHDDIVFLRARFAQLRMTTPIAKNPTRVFPVVIDELADKYGDAPALISDRERLSYRALAERANRYARWARPRESRQGRDGLPADAEPAGIHGRLDRHHQRRRRRRAVNTNLIGTALAHCIDIVEPKHVVVAAELAASFATARALLKTKPKIWSHGESAE